MPGEIVTEARRDQADPWFATHLRDIQPDAPAWRNVSAGYTLIADYLRAHEIPLIVVSLPVSWDFICRRVDCDAQAIRYSELDAGSGPFYAALKERFQAITPNAFFAAD